MNYSYFKIIFITFVLLLAGCRQNSYTYDYLMLHPVVMQREMTKCQMSASDDAQCEVVKRAINDFSVLVGESQTNPEQFGDKILKAEMKLQELKKADGAVYQKQFFDVRVMLAVIGVMRIE